MPQSPREPGQHLMVRDTIEEQLGAGRRGGLGDAGCIFQCLKIDEAVLESTEIQGRDHCSLEYCLGPPLSASLTCLH